MLAGKEPSFSTCSIGCVSPGVAQQGQEIILQDSAGRSAGGAAGTDRPRMGSSGDRSHRGGIPAGGTGGCVCLDSAVVKQQVAVGGFPRDF